jgi:hypothetical protein
MKNKSHSQTSTSNKPEKADISDAEFRRRLKNISEWRKKNLIEWRKKGLGKPHTKNPGGSLLPPTP